MKTKCEHLCRLAVYVFISIFIISYNAFAEEAENRWQIGARMGAILPSQEPGRFLDSHPIGFMFIDGNVGYSLTRHISVGVELQMGNNVIDVPHLELGTNYMLSLIPFIKYRFHLGDRFVIYPFAGIGWNFNIFEISTGLDDACFQTYREDSACSVDSEDTLAIKAGAGAEYFFWSNTALALDVEWKLNAGRIKVNIGQETIGSDDLDLSAINILVGLQHYF